MRHFIILFAVLNLLSCIDKREGIPEESRNYSDTVLNRNNSLCTAYPSDGIFVFNKLNADSIANAIRLATVTYFGDEYSTIRIQDSIHHWLSNDFFSRKTVICKSWVLNADIDSSKLTRNYRTFYTLHEFGIGLYYENYICIKKLIGNLGSCKYKETDENGLYSMSVNRLRFLCEFNVDIIYSPQGIFKSSKREYYRVTLTDTADLFTGLVDSNFVYR